MDKPKIRKKLQKLKEVIKEIEELLGDDVNTLDGNEDDGGGAPHPPTPPPPPKVP